MKAIIYAGIGLFSVATVYGVADYYSSQKKGTLDKLYAEEEITTAPVDEEKTTTVLPVKNAETEVAENKTVATKAKASKKMKNSIKEIKLENFSRARIPESIVKEEKIEEPLKKAEVLISEKVNVVPEEKVVVKEEPVRKISLDMYSRAPLKKQAKPVKKVTSKD